MVGVRKVVHIRSPRALIAGDGSVCHHNSHHHAVHPDRTENHYLNEWSDYATGDRGVISASGSGLRTKLFSKESLALFAGPLDGE